MGKFEKTKWSSHEINEAGITSQKQIHQEKQEQSVFSASSGGFDSTRLIPEYNDNFTSGSSEDEHHGKVLPTNAAIKKNEKSAGLVGKPNKFIQALELPVIVNMNPRSIYNKVEEFETFIKIYIN